MDIQGKFVFLETKLHDLKKKPKEEYSNILIASQSFNLVSWV